MNTFLPYLDFAKCAECLDNKRLFKQVVEAKQIIDILTTGKTKSGKDYPLSMKHYPIVKAWSKDINTLILYYNVCLDEVLKRKKVNTSLKPYEWDPNFTPKLFVLPDWLTQEVATMYQAHLLRKDPTYYQFNVDPIIPFDWNLIK